jgi:hypothetical protein
LQYGFTMRRAIYFFLTLGFILSGTTPVAGLPSSTYTLAQEAVSSPGQAVLVVRVKPSAAIISLDGTVVGSSTWTGTVSPGQHHVFADSPDHFPFGFLIVCAENTKYTIDISLKPHTGFLSLQVDPQDAMVYIDGTMYGEKLIELPIGTRTVLVKKFGYKENRSTITIFRDRISSLTAQLQIAPFEAKSFRTNPLAFDTKNSGLYDRIFINFSVSGPGKARIIIRNSSGTDLYVEDLPEFKTWTQQYVWKGTGMDGKALPDGTYSIILELKPSDQVNSILTQEGSPAALKEKGLLAQHYSELAPLVLESQVKIDSSKKIVPTGNSQGRIGLAFMWDPKVGEVLPGSIDFSYGTTGKAGLSIGLKLGQTTAFAFEGLALSSTGGFSAGFIQGLGSPAFVNLAIAGRFAWASGPIFAYPASGSQIELGMPLAISLRGLRFGVSPALVYQFSDSSFSGRLGLGAWFESRSCIIGGSAQQTIDGNGIMNSRNPLLVAGEAKILFKNLPFTFMTKLEVAMVPECTDAQASLGLGIAW